MIPIIAALVLLITTSIHATTLDIDTRLGANSALGDVVVTKMSYFREKANAKPLQWDDDLATKAWVEANNCDLVYDVGVDATRKQDHPMLRVM